MLTVVELRKMALWIIFIFLFILLHTFYTFSTMKNVILLQWLRTDIILKSRSFPSPRSNPFSSCFFELHSLTRENRQSPSKREKHRNEPWNGPELSARLRPPGRGRGRSTRCCCHARPRAQRCAHGLRLSRCHAAKQNGKQSDLGRKGANLPPLNLNGFL